jgi:DNA-binding MarR family transcriptional regulator
MIFHEAYLGKRLQDLLTLSHQQMQSVYEKRGLIISVEGSSTLQVLKPGTKLALADLARILEQPHQLVAQRIQKLVRLDLVIKQPDPLDGRRTEYVLTTHGEQQWQLLNSLMIEGIEVNRGLFNEIGIDLLAGLDAAISALNTRSFAERFTAKETDIQDATND